MGRPPIERTIKTCEHEECRQSFEVTAGKAQQARRFCSKDCSNKATAEARGASYRANYGYVAPTCPCGKAIESTERRGYAYTKKYCDDDCRRKYAPRRQRDESKWGAYVCQNEDCGKTFERRKSTRHAKLFCSNACAMRHTKTRRFYAVEDFDVVFESSYEAFFWGACKIAGIPIERFDRQYGINYDPARSEAWYAPDFWLPTLQLAVEIKGFEDDLDQVRWEQWPGRLAVFAKAELETASPTSLLQRLTGDYGLQIEPSLVPA